ncbi:MAG: DNA polymerase III subunit delta [Thermodesulfobacteriota bacterium]
MSFQTAIDKLLPVYLLYGNEGALVEDGANRVKGVALKGGMADLNFHLFIAREAAAAEIVSVAMTMPAMSKRRVVLVKGVDTLRAKSQDTLAEYVKDPSPSTCLILTAESGKVKKNSALYRAVAKCGHIELFNRISAGRLATIVRQDVKKGGREITDDAVAKLLSLTGKNLRSVQSEVQKMLLFIGSKGIIEVGDVEEGVADVKEENIFGLTDALGMRDGRRALDIFSKIADEPAPKLLFSITQQFRRIWKAKALRKRGVEPGKFPPLLGVPPYKVKGYLTMSNRFSEAELSRIFHRLKVIDGEIKSGGIPHSISLSRFVVQLCS